MKYIPPATLRPTLHRIFNDTPWTNPRSYTPDPDPIERLRANARRRHSWFASLVADWSDIISEVRDSPYSHALIALLTVVAWTAILVVPLLIGLGK